MAKRSKAKAKRAKTAKTKKAKTKTKKPIKKIRTGARGTDDPCAAQQQAVEEAQLEVDKLTNEINDPDIPPAVRKKAQNQMRTASKTLTFAQRALDECRRQHP